MLKPEKGKLQIMLFSSQAKSLVYREIMFGTCSTQVLNFSLSFSTAIVDVVLHSE